MPRFLLPFLVATALGGCGIKGTLAVPPPVFGGEATATPPTASGEDPVKDAIDADPLTPELPSEEDDVTRPEPGPFYGPEVDDTLGGRRE